MPKGIYQRPLGYTLSEEIRRKISKALKGKPSWNKGMKGYTNAGGYKKGHIPWTKGRKRPEISERMSGEKSPNWKGDKVGYTQLHRWIRKKLPKPLKCEICQEKEPYDLANKSGKYKRELTDWQWLCRHCHMVIDKRILNLKQYKICSQNQ